MREFVLFAWFATDWPLSVPPPPSQYGRNALEIVMKSIVKLDSPLVSPPSDFKGDFFKGTAFNVSTHLEIIRVSHFACE